MTPRFERIAPGKPPGMGTGIGVQAGARPRVGVPSCLLGAPVRCDGGHSRHRFLAHSLDQHVDWVPVCPEAEIGLGVPREPLRLERAAGADRAVASRGGADHTGDLRAVADRHREALGGLDGFVLHNESPSCGLFDVPVFESRRRVGDNGRGAFAARVVELLPDLPVEEQSRLSRADQREHFVERIFAHARLRALFTAAGETGPGDWAEDAVPAWRPRDLVAFHTCHKLQLMAHSPEGYRRAGRVAATAGSAPADEVSRAYTDVFTRALARPSTPGRTVNALQHAFGMVSAHLDDVRRREVLEVVERYRNGLAPLDAPIALIRRHCADAGIGWAARQTFLAPYPAGLGPGEAPQVP